MSLTDQDFQDIRLSRPVSVTDLWDIDDRISRLEKIADRLERAVVAFGKLPVVRGDGGRKFFVDLRDLEDYVQKNKMLIGEGG
jgi:hypothetical protein